MARPDQDRAKIEVWARRSSLAWLTATATAVGKPRSALIRDLLTEAIAARQGEIPIATKPHPPVNLGPIPAGCDVCACAVPKADIKFGSCDDCGHPRFNHAAA